MRLERGEPRDRVKRRRKRDEHDRIAKIRPLVVERDGYCRLARRIAQQMFGQCRGPSEWAHAPWLRRSKTMGRPPEDRHRTDGSFMLCDGHSDALDYHRIDVEPRTERGADGPCRWTRRVDSVAYVEEDMHGEEE